MIFLHLILQCKNFFYKIQIFLHFITLFIIFHNKIETLEVITIIFILLSAVMH